MPKRYLSYKVQLPAYIVNTSGGLSSFEALRRAIEQKGKEHVHPVFADTLSEDPDLYRFLDDQERYFGITIDRLSDGRDIWEVFRDRKAIKLPRQNNTAPCSTFLKRKIIEEAVKAAYATGTYIHVAGLDWSETHRIEQFKAAHPDAECWFPCNEKPYPDNCSIAECLESVGIKVPELYTLGFSHNNCGGAASREVKPIGLIFTICGQIAIGKLSKKKQSLCSS